MTDSNKDKDLLDRPSGEVALETNIATDSALGSNNHASENLNIDDLDLDTLERLTNPQTSANDTSDHSQSLAQATLAGDSYCMDRSEYIKNEPSDPVLNDFGYEKESHEAREPSSTEDVLSADDIALAVSNFNSSPTTTGASTVSSPTDQNNTEISSLGTNTDQEVSNMLQDSQEPSQSVGVDVTMPQEEEPQLKVYADDEMDQGLVESHNNLSQESQDSQNPNTDNANAQESLAIADLEVMKDTQSFDEHTDTAISGLSERVITPVEEHALAHERTMTPEELAIIAQVGSSKDESHTQVNDEQKAQMSDDLESKLESVAIPDQGVMKDAQSFDGDMAISGLDHRVITPVEEHALAHERTMTPEELAIIAQVGSSNHVHSADTTSNSLPIPEQGVMKDAQSFDGDMAISGLDHRVITPVEDNSLTSNRTMSADELAIIAQVGSSREDNHANTTSTSLPIPEQGVMKGAQSFDGDMAISGLNNRFITPLEDDNASSGRAMTKEELDLIAQIGGSLSHSNTNDSVVSNGRTIEPRENDLFHQTGSSNIARDMSSIQESDQANIFKDATVMDEGHTAIVGLDNMMVAQEAPENSTVITGASASYIDQIQEINEQAARQNQIHLEAKAKFQEEMAAEQALLEQELASEANNNDHEITSTDYQNDDYGIYDGIAVPDYQGSEQNLSAEYYESDFEDHSEGTHELQDTRLKQPSEPNNYYDYSQYDESEVQAMPTDEPVKEDDGPNYVLGARDNFNHEEHASGDNDDNPYSYGTYANKLAHQNALRNNNDQDPTYLDQEHHLDNYEPSFQDDLASDEHNLNGSEQDEPIYYGTYASRLANDSTLRNVQKNKSNAYYISPSEYAEELHKERFNEEELAYDQDEPMNNEEHHAPEPSGMGDGALSQLNLKNSSDNAPYYMASQDKLKQGSSDDGPVYLVGVKRNKGEINEQRSKLMEESALDAYEEAPTPEEEAAYMKELADAARESMAAPNSDVVKRARMLASQPSDKDKFNNAELNLTDPQASFAKNEAKLVDNNGEVNDRELAKSNNIVEQKQQQLNATLRREEDGNYNFSNMTIKDNVGLGMMIFLYIRQLLASFFSHTTLPLIAPNLSKNLGQSYPSSMPIPFFFVGLIAGAIGSILHSTIGLDYVGSISFLVYLLLTGLAAYRGIHRICAFVSRKWKRDSVLTSASVMVPILIFIWLANTLIVKTDGIVEATASFAIASMLSAATAASLTWNFSQDPMDSIGNMSTRGLLFVILISLMAAFGLLHYTVGLSVFGVSIVSRLVFGYFISKNQGTANRPYVYALQLITFFAILFDLILLKSQNYEFLSQSSLELVSYLRHYSNFF